MNTVIVNATEKEHKEALSFRNGDFYDIAYVQCWETCADTRVTASDLANYFRLYPNAASSDGDDDSGEILTLNAILICSSILLCIVVVDRWHRSVKHDSGDISKAPLLEK